MIDIYPTTPAAPAHVAGAYGEMYIADNVATLTLVLQNNFYQWVTGWVVGENNGTTPSVAGTMRSDTTGVYMSTCSIAANVTGAGQVLEFALFRNGIYQPDHSAHVTLPNNTGNAVTLSGIITLANGDILTLRCQNISSAGKLLTIEDCNLSIHQI